MEREDRGRWVIDIETMSNFFSYYGFNINTRERIYFIIHESNNQLLEFINHLRKCELHITFNGLAFDEQIIAFIINNYKNWEDLNGEEISKLIYIESQRVIEASNNNRYFEVIPEWKLPIKIYDLFKIWHFNNKARSSSLKWIQFSIDFPNLEESPIFHSKKIEKRDIQSILDYNLNDVMATYELYKITIGETDYPLYKGIDKLQLRRDIQKEFGLNCINYNDVRIGDELNKFGYCKEKNIEKKEIPLPNKVIKELNFGECYPEYTKFETMEFNNFINALARVKIEIKERTLQI